MFPAHRFENEVNGFFKKILAKIADRLYIKSYDVFAPISEYTNYWFHTFWGNDNNSKIIFPPVISEQEIDNLYVERKEALKCGLAVFDVDAIDALLETF